MSKSKRKLKYKTEIEFEAPEPVEPKPLNEESIYFWTDIPERLSKTVPPSTPVGTANILILPFPIPETFPSLDDFEIPYVRDVGIKSCIELFGRYLGCTNYMFDYIQFWLLDVITDCLWRTQDDYSFTKPEQKLVLEWILYMFKVMRDPTICFSRKQFFKLFKEAILMAGQLVQEGYKVIPKPDDLFELIFQKDRDNQNCSSEQTMESSNLDPSDSGSTFTISKDTSEQIVLMNIGDEERKYILKQKVCSCEQGSTASYETTFTTDMTKTTDSVENIEEEPVLRDEEEILAAEGIEEEIIEDCIQPFQYKDYKMFYNPNTKVPDRFLPLNDIDIGVKTDNEKEPRKRIVQLDVPPCRFIGDVLLLDNDSKGTKSSADETATKKRSEKKSHIGTSTSTKGTGATTRDFEFDKLSSDEKVQMWQDHNLREQELKDMNDSKIGMIPSEERLYDICEQTKKEMPERIRYTLKDETVEMLRQMLADMDVEDCAQETCGLGIEHKTKNLLILCAIIDLVFDYFYQNFHFTLLKLALKTNPSTLIQKVNTEWSVPKQNLGELIKPKPIPKKKEKEPKKEKKGKKEKKDKGKKSKDKKDKVKEKKDKKGKKEQKEKPKKLTKEELKQLKAEQDLQRMLEEQLEEDKRKVEENRRFIFPLADAANDDLYKELFEGWEKPKDEKEKGGKDKKGKKKK